MADGPIIIQSGFKSRPLREGDGKPSPGRRPPPMRPTSRVATWTSRTLTLWKRGSPSTCSSLPPWLPMVKTLMQNSPRTWPQECHWSHIPYLDLSHRLARERRIQGEATDWNQILMPVGRDYTHRPRIFQNKSGRPLWRRVALGMVEGLYPQEEAAQRCGCTVEELCPALRPLMRVTRFAPSMMAVGAGPMPTFNRTRRRRPQRPQLWTVSKPFTIRWLNTGKEDPTPAVATGTDMGWEHFQKTTTWAILKADVMKAHRRINIAKDGWRFQVAQLDGEWWVNKVGTYGMASAQLLVQGRSSFPGGNLQLGHMGWPETQAMC